MSTLQPAPGVVPLARVRHTFLGSGLPGALSRALPGDSFVRELPGDGLCPESVLQLCHGFQRDCSARPPEEEVEGRGVVGPRSLWSLRSWGLCFLAWWPEGLSPAALCIPLSLPPPSPGKLWVSGCSLAGGISFLSSVV